MRLSAIAGRGSNLMIMKNMIASYVAVSVLSVLLAGSEGANVCGEVTACTANGVRECTPGNSTCPPCVYALDNRFTCWDKDPNTNTCPFTGVKYDCTNEWGRSANGLSNEGVNGTTGSSSSVNESLGSGAGDNDAAGLGSTEIIVAAGALLLIIVIIVIVAVMRRNKNVNQDQFVHERATTKKGGDDGYDKRGGLGGHYNYHRKVSEPAMLESGRASEVGLYNVIPTGQNISVDGMLGDRPDPVPLMVGSAHRAPPGHTVHRGEGPGMGYGGPVHGAELPVRIASNANMFDEYLRMKQEMNYDVDALSDLDSELYSDTMSERKLSIGSSILDGHNRTMSITDSEYADDFRRSRGESDCFSEMSYNDEKYSFSEEDRDDSIKGLDREVEI